MRRIPMFKNDEERAKFWQEHSFADFVEDTDEADIILRRNEGESSTVSITLSKEDLNLIKEFAREMGITPVTLMKLWIKEKLLVLKREQGKPKAGDRR